MPPMGKSTSFADNIKILRDQLGLTQEDLAQALGVSFASVNRWENGKTSPSKLAVLSLERFCEEMKREGKLGEE